MLVMVGLLIWEHNLLSLASWQYTTKDIEFPMIWAVEMHINAAIPNQNASLSGN